MDEIHKKLAALRNEDRIRGLIAETHEIVFRHSLMQREHIVLREEISILNSQIQRLTDDLQNHMTRTYEAEKILSSRTHDFDLEIESARRALIAIQKSRSYRIGRFLTGPIRLFRRVDSQGDKT